MAHRPTARATRRRRVRRKNLPLRRWLRKFAEQPDDRGEQWWREFDALMSRTRTRLRPIDA